MKIVLDTDKFWLGLLRFAWRRMKTDKKVPVGIPTIRDPEAQCTGYYPRKRKPGDWDCESDGHYLCTGCAHYKPEVPVEGS